MKNEKEIGTPMSPTCKLDKDKNGKSINEKLYKDIIGSLFYLTAVDQTYFLVFACMQDSNLILKNHMLAIKRIF